MEAEETAAEFQAWFENATFTKMGDLRIVIVVPRRDKAKALPITDYTGVQFTLKVIKAPPIRINELGVRATVSQLTGGAIDVEVVD